MSPETRFDLNGKFQQIPQSQQKKFCKGAKIAQLKPDQELPIVIRRLARWFTLNPIRNRSRADKNNFVSFRNNKKNKLSDYYLFYLCFGVVTKDLLRSIGLMPLTPMSTCYSRASLAVRCELKKN